MFEISSIKTGKTIFKGALLLGLCSISIQTLAGSLTDDNYKLQLSSFNPVILQSGSGNKLTGVIGNVESHYLLQGSEFSLSSPNIGLFQGLRASVLDTDGDGYPDDQDAFPFDASEWLDTDGDTIGNNADLDDDNDGMPDTWEQLYGLDPLNANDAQFDNDSDGVTNLDEYLQGTNPLVADGDDPTGTVYEDAEDETTQGWVIYDQKPVGATINNVHDVARSSQVISFQGSGTQNGYRLGNHASKANAWDNTSQKIISWDLNFSENFLVLISVDTGLGQRFLVYRPLNLNLGIRGSGGNYVHMGLGSAARDGQWHTITRDLETDLQVFEAGNQILSVNGFWVRGSGRLDNIALSTSQPNSVFEDAEDGNTSGWVVYDQTPSGALINNENDAAKGSRVISVQGSGTQNGYRLGNHAGKAGAWNNTSQKVISWDMKFSENFKLFVTVDTPLGQRYLVYRPVNTDSGIGGTNGNYIHHGLGIGAKNGQWQSFSRDLQADLQEFEAGNQILSVNGVLIRGSGKVDEIKLF